MTKRPAEDERPLVPVQDDVSVALAAGRLAAKYYGLERLRRDPSSRLFVLPADVVHSCLAPLLSREHQAPGPASRPSDPGYTRRTKTYPPPCEHVLGTRELAARFQYKRHLVMPNGSHVLASTTNVCVFYRSGKQWHCQCYRLNNDHGQLKTATAVSNELRFAFRAVVDQEAHLVDGGLQMQRAVDTSYSVPASVCASFAHHPTYRPGQSKRYECQFADGGGAVAYWRGHLYRCRILGPTGDLVTKGSVLVNGNMHGIVHDSLHNICFVMGSLGEPGLMFAWLNRDTLEPFKQLVYKMDPSDRDITVELVAKSVTVDAKGRISLLAMNLSIVTLE